MQLQILASGSRGNVAYLRSAGVSVLIDAGLSARELALRLEMARLPLLEIEHILITHGHLDHARSAGILGKRLGVTLHTSDGIAANRSIARAKRRASLSPGRPSLLRSAKGPGEIEVRAVSLPHDADPTYALDLRSEGRRAVILTDLGFADERLAESLSGAHVLVLESNHDLLMLERGPYSPALKRRIQSDRGHLSNLQSCKMLERLVSDRLHTLVLAHLSETNNEPARAQAGAKATLDRLGMGHVQVLLATQDQPGPLISI